MRDRPGRPSMVTFQCAGLQRSPAFPERQVVRADVNNTRVQLKRTSACAAIDRRVLSLAGIPESNHQLQRSSLLKKRPDSIAVAFAVLQREALLRAR
jgi:hypothetical protein